MPTPCRRYFGKTKVSYKSKMFSDSNGFSRYIYYFTMPESHRIVADNSAIHKLRLFLDAHSDITSREFGFSCMDSGIRGKHQKEGLVYCKCQDTFIPFMSFPLVRGVELKLVSYPPQAVQPPFQDAEPQEHLNPPVDAAALAPPQEVFHDEGQGDGTEERSFEEGIDIAGTVPSVSSGNSLFIDDDYVVDSAGYSFFDGYAAPKLDPTLVGGKTKPRPEIPSFPRTQDDLDLLPLQVEGSPNSSQQFSKDGNLFFHRTPINKNKIIPK